MGRLSLQVAYPFMAAHVAHAIPYFYCSSFISHLISKPIPFPVECQAPIFSFFFAKSLPMIALAALDVLGTSLEPKLFNIANCLCVGGAP